MYRGLIDMQAVRLADIACSTRGSATGGSGDIENGNNAHEFLFSLHAFSGDNLSNILTVSVTCY